MNKIIILGNLGKDPEIRTLSSGQKVASFSVATVEKWKDKDGNKKEATDWHNVEAWGAITDVIEKYLKKGSKVYIEGKMKYQEYEKDGQKRTIAKIQMEKLEMLDGKPTTQTVGEKKPDPVPPINIPEFEDTDGLPF